MSWGTNASDAGVFEFDPTNQGDVLKKGYRFFCRPFRCANSSEIVRLIIAFMLERLAASSIIELALWAVFSVRTRDWMASRQV